MIDLRNMTIKNKLTAIMMLVSGAAVFLSCIILIFSAFFLLRKEHVGKDRVLGGLTARNVQAALMFNVPEDAEKILSSLEADSSVVFACIYTADGSPFAVYQKEGVAIEPPPVGQKGYEYSANYLKIFDDISFEGKKIGTVYLLDDQSEFYASFRLGILTLVFVLLIALVSSYILANKLQAIISQPILTLAQTAGAIKISEDYSIRAEKYGEDEVGVLIDSFNSMLDEIQRREDDLAKSEAKFRSIVETSSDWIWEVDTEGKYIYSSPKIRELLGYEPQEVLGKTPYDFMNPEEAARVEIIFGEITENREPVKSLENINIHKDGRKIVLETRAVPIFDEKGEYHGYRGIDRDITNRKRVEIALKISEANYRAIFDSVNDAIFIHEFDTANIIQTNGQASMMFGYSPRELKEMSLKDISVIEEGFNQEKALDMMSKAASEGPQLFEWHFKNKYGRLFWGEASLRTVAMEGRKCLLTLVRDIDERKRAKDALASSEARFRALAESANSGMISVNQSGRIIFWNPAAEKIFGYSADEAISQLFSLIMSGQHFEQYSHDLEKIRLTGQSSYTGKIIELMGRKKDGKEFPMEMSLSKWSTSEGLFFTAILTDITERKETVESLRLDEARLEALVELNQMTNVTEKELVDFALEQAIQLTKSKIGYIAFTNEDETVLNMYSWSRTAMAECMISEKPLVYLVEETGLWGEAVRQRRPIITNDYQGPEPLKKGYPKGHVHVTRHMNIPVFDGQRIVAVAGVGNKEDEYNDSDVRQLTLLMDGMWRIIQRNKIEQERKEFLRTLASKNEELESIVYTASHDLRSPLVNIDGFSSELACSCKELTETLTHTSLPDQIEHTLSTIVNEEIPASLKYIRSSATKMDMLMRGLLKLSRLGREATEIESLDMNELIKNVRHGMQHQITKQKVELVVDDLPSCLGDKTQISQVFTNLLDNAIKYLDPNRKGRVHVAGKTEDGESVYSVSDNGVGIDPQCYQKIFEVFHRLDPEGSVIGEGIGLTIVKRIIDRHNGRMWVESTVGEGTTFYVAFRNSNKQLPISE